MRALVVAASKYGSTTEIAEAIVGVLNDRGIDTAMRAPDDVDTLEGFDAAVLGSAVYAGHWLKPATEIVERLAQELSDRPVWLFSSGPIGDPPKPQEDPVDVAKITDTIAAREHRVFAGKLVRKQLSFAEKAITVALRAPEGDFRDWDAVRSWASQIADALDAQRA